MGKVRIMWEYFNPILKYVSHWTRVTLFYHFIKLRSDDSIEVKPFLREKTRHFSEMINDFHARRDPARPREDMKKKNCFWVTPHPLFTSSAVVQTRDLWKFRFRRQVYSDYISRLHNASVLHVPFKICLSKKLKIKFIAFP